MIILVFLVSLLLHVEASPLSFGPVTTPTIAHTILFGRQAQCDCGGMMQRTLLDIVRSCLLTIAACVYRAIHQNIPDPKATWQRRLWVKAKITVLALFAPEMMIWWAMKQWMGAKVIRDKINRDYPQLQWTLTHGHFVQMGGFIRKDTGQVLFFNELVDHLKNRRIDMAALRKITVKEIQDHSKGDFLSKALVTLQTSWFVLECITRWQQKLLLTELEVVTLAFAVLNMLTYGFWWHKPLDVLCPFELDILVPTAASVMSQTPQDVDGDTERTHLIPLQLSQSAEPLPTPPKPSKMKAIGSGARAIFSLFPTIYKAVGAAFNSWWDDVADVASSSGLISAGLSAMFTPFANLAESLSDIFETDDVSASNDHIGTHVPTFYAMKISDGRWTLILVLSCFVGMIFGAIHFLSWNSAFHTHTESLLWRTSSVILVTEPFLVALITFWLGIADDLEDSLFDNAILTIGAFCGFLSTIGSIAYVLARVCLLVLAFLTLRRLPSNVFENVSWTSYIPHL